MKLLTIAAMLLFAFSLVGCETTGSPARAPLDPNNADAQVMVMGMSCPQCANNIKKIMESVDGVDQARVDLGEGRVLVAFSEGQTVTEDRLKKAVTDSGFTAGEVTNKNDTGAGR